jgi:hypothetical protein
MVGIKEDDGGVSSWTGTGTTTTLSFAASETSFVGRKKQTHDVWGRIYDNIHIGSVKQSTNK